MTFNKGKELSQLTRGLGHGAISAIHCCVPLAKPLNPAGQPTNPDFSPESPEPLKTSQSQEHQAGFSLCLTMLSLLFTHVKQGNWIRSSKSHAAPSKTGYLKLFHYCVYLHILGRLYQRSEEAYEDKQYKNKKREQTLQPDSQKHLEQKNKTKVKVVTQIHCHLIQ